MRRNQITKFYVPKKNSYFDCISIRNGKVNLDLTLKVIKNTSECCRVNAQTRNDGTHTPKNVSNSHFLHVSRTFFKGF